MNNLHDLLLTIVQGAADIPDPQVSVKVQSEGIVNSLWAAKIYCVAFDLLAQYIIHIFRVDTWFYIDVCLIISESENVLQHYEKADWDLGWVNLFIVITSIIQKAQYSKIRSQTWWDW